MSRTTQLNWDVPKPEWDAFVSLVSEEHELESFYLRLEIESAMKEWINLDEYADHEDLVDRLVEVYPHSLNRFPQTQYSISTDEDSDVEMVQVTTSINTDLVDRFREFTRENTEYRMGIALAHALWHRRHGGRSQRIAAKLQRLIDAETDDTSDYNPVEQDIHYSDVDLDRLDGRSRKKKVYQIAQRLDPGPNAMLHREQELRAAIADIAGPSVIDEYVEDVVDVLNFKQHPSNSILYVHESWEPEIETETAADAELPAIDRKTFDDMTKAERIEGIRIALARKADENGGVYAADYNFIRTRAFDRTVSKGYASNIMEDVADEDADGFTFDTQHGSKRIKVDTVRICDSLLESAGLSEPPAVEQDRNQEASESDLKAEVDAKMDELMQGTPKLAGEVATTDGGTDVW